MFLGVSLISWSFKKQHNVARSSEYKPLVDVVAELTWIQSILNELGVHLPEASIMWCNNIGGATLSVNLVFHTRRKHVEIDFAKKISGHNSCRLRINWPMSR